MSGRLFHRLLTGALLTALGVAFVRTWVANSNRELLARLERRTREPPLELGERGGLLPALVPQEDSIFLVETSAATRVDPKVLCSLESAARYHPNSVRILQLTSR